jgi:hypothetical protein
MSRYDGRPEREPHAETRDHTRERSERSPDTRAPWSPGRDLLLPRTEDRRPVDVDRDRFHLRGSEAHILATVGAFRVVPEHELRTLSEGLAADVRSLSDQRLIESRTITINDRPERVLVLTPAAHALLEAHGDPATTGESRAQEYYVGIVKPRELAHDAQLYRMFEIEREHLEGEGARVTRVVLDYEMKRDYHTFVHEQENAGVDAADARRAFASTHDLPFAREHIELPDIRIEYEDADGRQMHRDLELATEHYSRSRISGKHSAGFRVYRAAGVRGARSGRAGGTPVDPHHLQWLR